MALKFVAARSLIAASLALQAIAPIPVMAQTPSGKVNTFRFGTSAMSAPEFLQADGTIATLTGEATEIDVSATDPKWSYTNAANALVHSLDSGTLPPGSTLESDGRLKVAAFATTGVDYNFVVKATNKGGLSATHAFRIASDLPTAVAAAGLIPNSVTSSIQPSLAAASFYDGDATALPVAAGEVLTFKFDQFVSASQILAVLALGAPSSEVRVSYVKPDGSTSSATTVMLASGGSTAVALPAGIISQEFSFQFTSATSIADIRVDSGIEAARPVFAYASGSTLLDIGAAANKTIALISNPAGSTMTLTAGALPPGASFSGGNLVLGSYTSPLGGPWAFAVRATKPGGFVSQVTTFYISADTSSLVAASTLLPSSVAASGVLGDSQYVTAAPTKMYMNDGSDSTTFRSTGPSSNLDLSLASPATFDKVYVKSTGDLSIQLKQADGNWNWVATAPANPVGGVFSLGQSYAAQDIRIASPTSTVADVKEFRIGAGQAAAYPVSLLPATRVWPSGGVVVSQADFQATSPWSSALTLSLAGTIPPGVTTDGASIIIASEPTADVVLTVLATGTDGLSTRTTTRIQPAPIVDAATILPSSITPTTGMNIAATTLLTALADGIDANSYLNLSATSGAILEYAQPVSMSGAYIKSNTASNVTLSMETATPGVYAVVKSNMGTTAGGYVAFGSTFTSRKFKLTGTNWIYEFRPNNVAATMAPNYTGLATRVPDANGVLLSASDFIDQDPFADEINLSFYSDGGLSATIANNKIILNQTPSVDTYFRVWAANKWGLKQIFNFTIKAPAGANPMTTAPTEVVASLGASGILGGVDPVATLFDDADATYVNTTSGTFTIEYPQPITVSSVYIKNAKFYAANLAMEGVGPGSWQTIKTGLNSLTGENISLGGTFTGKKFMISAGGSVYEFRLGGAPAMKAPLYAGSISRSPDANGVILKPSDFIDQDPYADEINLSIFYNDGALPLTVSDNQIMLNGTITSDGSFRVRAASKFGMSAISTIQVKAPQGANAASFAPVVVSQGGSSGFVGASGAQAISDGLSTTYANLSAGTFTLEFPQPVTVSTMFLKGTTTNLALYVEGDTPGIWTLVKGSMSSTTGTTLPLGGTFTGKKFRVNGTGNVQEFNLR